MRSLVVVALAALAVFASQAAGAPGRASLRTVDLAPLTLRGDRFEPRERVRVVTTVGGRRYVRVVQATSAGSFTVTYRGVAVDRCNDVLFVLALGGAGSRAALKLPQLLCPPALAP